MQEVAVRLEGEADGEHTIPVWSCLPVLSEL